MNTVGVYELITPVTVEAKEVTHHNLREIAKWCKGIIWDGVGFGVSVPVSNGEKIRTALPGWYVIKSRAGDFSIMEPVAFANKYRFKEVKHYD